MEQSEASKCRQRVYTPSGVPAPKQKEISRRTAQLEAEKLKEKETVKHRRASAQWEGIAARLGKPTVEGKRAASSPLCNVSGPGSDLLEGDKRAASSSLYDVGASGLRVESREMIREMIGTGEKYERRKEFVGDRKDEEAKIQEDERVTGAATTSRKSSGPTHKPLRKPSSYFKENTHTSALSDELDMHETTQFPLEESNIPDVVTNRTKYTMFASSLRPIPDIQANPSSNVPILDPYADHRTLRPKPSIADLQAKILNPKSSNPNLQTRTLAPKASYTYLQPKILTPKPSERNLQSRTLAPKASYTNLQYRTLNPKVSDSNLRPRTLAPKPSYTNLQPSTLVPKASYTNIQQRTVNLKSSNPGLQPRTLPPKPSNGNLQHRTLTPRQSNQNLQHRTLTMKPSNRTLQFRSLTAKVSNVALRPAHGDPSIWGPSGPPPIWELPTLPPSVEASAREAYEKDRAWNRHIRAEEKREKRETLKAKGLVDDCDLSFFDDVDDEVV